VAGFADGFHFFPKRKLIFKKENQGALNLAIFSRG
jgi:hypothetical protein